MKKQSWFQKTKEKLASRWNEEDYPGGTPRFQLRLLTKDIAIFGLMPLLAIICYKIVEASMSAPTRPIQQRKIDLSKNNNEKHSQIIHFKPIGSTSGVAAFSKRAPGTLVRVRLLNVVETYSSAPVHVQVVDNGLGKEFLGATIIGDASSESSIGRIKIDFKFVRPPHRNDQAVPISARAVSLDGTFALNATKKEGLFARAAIRSASGNTGTIDLGSDNQDFKTLVARAIAAGFMQEFQGEASVAHNNAQVLALKPMTEFFVELTDYFLGQK